ncbi:hypothetical protein DERP_008289 [Dermatophagoides pteronyssinus]|uniref:Uncharacterized protein n=1 Tax=Dermatophagoides pteronyssinus TaxID=6956 RepID=A0ABQ8J657_DERPT|nr:hypothetical protein DERP_008289 [Dermatophagoides pteronyssinus]
MISTYHQMEIMGRHKLLLKKFHQSNSIYVYKIRINAAPANAPNVRPNPARFKRIRVNNDPICINFHFF